MVFKKTNIESVAFSCFSSFLYHFCKSCYAEKLICLLEKVLNKCSFFRELVMDANVFACDAVNIYQKRGL